MDWGANCLFCPGIESAQRLQTEKVSFMPSIIICKLCTYLCKVWFFNGGKTCEWPTSSWTNTFRVCLEVYRHAWHCTESKTLRILSQRRKPVPSCTSIGNVGSGSSSKVTDFVQKNKSTMQQLAKCKNICEKNANTGISSMCGLFLATTTCSANLVVVRFHALHSSKVCSTASVSSLECFN